MCSSLYIYVVDALQQTYPLHTYSYISTNVLTSEKQLLLVYEAVQ